MCPYPETSQPTDKHRSKPKNKTAGKTYVSIPRNTTTNRKTPKLTENNSLNNYDAVVVVVEVIVSVAVVFVVPVVVVKLFRTIKK